MSRSIREIREKDLKAFPNSTKPFKRIEDERIYMRYLQQKDKRLFVYYIIARSGGFRCNEIRTMRVGELKEHISKREYYIYQSKTDSNRDVPIISQKTVELLEDYIKDKYDHEYLIPSRQMKNGQRQPLSYRQIQKLLSKYAKELGFERIGTHTPRKTNGFNAYHSNKQYGEIFALEQVAKTLGQKSIASASRYADIYEEVQKARVEATNNPIDLFW